MVDKKKKPLWQQMGRDTEEEEEEIPAEKPAYDWSGLKNRLIGTKTAAEVATEEVEKLKKKKGY